MEITENNIQSENNEVHPDSELISKKFFISRYVSFEQLGSQNLFLSSQILYKSLYDQEGIENIIGINPKFPDRIPTMRAALSEPPKNVPTEEEFIKELKNLLLKEIDYGDCIYDDAKIEMEELLRLCEHSVIWTDGDDKGYPEKNIPGSMEQIRRLVKSKFLQEIRQKVAEEKGVKRNDILSIVATEGKIEYIKDITESFISKGVDTVIFIEDRAKNIEEAKKIINEVSGGSISVFPVWVRQSEYKKDVVNGKSLDECISEYNGIDSIGDLYKLLKLNGIFSEGKKVGSVVDFDGVLSDNKKRIELQTKSLLSFLKKRQWI